VRVFLMGAKRWVDLPSWPPATVAQRLHLHPGGRLAAAEPPESRPDRHTYDPAHPTPSVGGPVLGFHAGPRDNRKLEARPDVLTYTSEPMTTPMTVLGSITVRVHLHADVRHVDVFARVCDVMPKGKSVNIADRIVRLGPDDFDADGMAVVDLELTPTGHSFLAGHRVRLQITGGAHPRYARNLGTGEHAITATTMVASTRQIFHDPAHKSWIDLPTFAG
jgi:putative CocE/NonD family hydrolase